MDLLEVLIAIEKRRCEAWLSRRKEDLAVLLDEAFVEINYFGRLSKEDVLEDLFERLHLRKFEMKDARLHGNPESPILSYSCFESIVVDGRQVDGEFHVASHFIRKGADWKILLWQITPKRSGG
jgi:hypothetical protein